MGSTGMDRFQQDMRDIFDSAVSAVYPPRMIRNAVKVSDDGSLSVFTLFSINFYVGVFLFHFFFSKCVLG